MKIPSIWTQALLCLLFLVTTSLDGITQVQTAYPNTSVDANCNGFYMYTPLGYGSGNQKYPLLVFIHGIAELGNGGSNLSLVLRNGPPKLIAGGLFPATFTVNSTNYSFLVMSPQFIAWPSSGDVDAVINYAISNYRVDPDRIYLTGLSMGGGVTWEYAGNVSVDYAKKLAAILPVCGASWPDLQRSRVMATANLPVWATHNLTDPVCPVAYTNGYVANIDLAPAPAPPAMKTIFPSGGHDAWTQTYDPAFTVNGLNVYQWMLQFKARGSGTLPVVLTDFGVFLSAGRQVTVSWTTSSEENDRFFSIEHSGDGIHFSPLSQVPAANLSTGSHYSYTDPNPLAGTNYYRLSQTDLDGKTRLLGIQSINLDALATAQFHAYPNPAVNQLTLQLNHPETGSLEVRIFSTDGKLQKLYHFQKQNVDWQQQIPVADLPSGFYNLQVLAMKIKISQGFIKN